MLFGLSLWPPALCYQHQQGLQFVSNLLNTYEVLMSVGLRDQNLFLFRLELYYFQMISAVANKVINGQTEVPNECGLCSVVHF